MGGICKEDNNIDVRFRRTTLLIGLKKNNNLFELNSFLQCIIHILPVANKIKYNYNKIKEQKGFKEYMKNGTCLTAVFQELIDKIWPDEANKKRKDKEYKKTESSEEILKMIYKIAPQFNENQQLLINFFLMRLHSELNKAENNSQNNNITIAESNKKIALQNYLNNFQQQNISIISDFFFGTYYTSSTCFFANIKNSNFILIFLGIIL
jgi:hypothetical protein